MTTTPPDPALPGDPSPYAAGAPAVTADASATTAPAPRMRRTLLWAAPLAGVLAVGGGTAVALMLTGGAQPDTVIPGTAVGYLRMDIDPSAGQKIAAVRLLSKLPEVKNTVEGDGDPRKKLLETLRKDNQALAGVNYDKDIAPWIGDRVAVGVMAPASGDAPEVVLALQVKDEDKARAGIKKLSSDASDQSDLTFRNGYALITEKGKGAEIAKAIDKGSLATNERYSGDMKALGEQGVLSGWVDLPALGKLALKEAAKNQSTPAAVEDSLDKAGRAAFALRFDADYLELAGVGRGAAAVKAGKGSDASELGKLPTNTAVAVSLALGPDGVEQGWKQLLDAGSTVGSDLPSQVGEIEKAFDVKLPDDLKTLLGSRLLLAMPEQDFNAKDELPKAGMRVTTDAAKAQEIVGKVEKVFADGGQQLPIVHKADGSSFYLATSEDYLGVLSADGSLDEDKAFQLAIPDAGREQFAAYVNLDRLEKAYLPDVPSEQRAFVEALRSAGLTASVTGDGESMFSLRLVGS